MSRSLRTKYFIQVQRESGGKVRTVEKREGVGEIPLRQHEEDSSLRSALLYYTGE